MRHDRAVLAHLAEDVGMNPHLRLSGPQGDTPLNLILGPNLANEGENRTGQQPTAVVVRIRHGPAGGRDFCGKKMLDVGRHESSSHAIVLLFAGRKLSVLQAAHRGYSTAGARILPGERWNQVRTFTGRLQRQPHARTQPAESARCDQVKPQQPASFAASAV
jgi:hypothetical protein